jgi:hypothetical protein
MVRMMAFFGLAKFAYDGVSFYDAKFTGGDVFFGHAVFTTVCSITWGPFESPAAWTALQEREQRQNEPPL